MNDTGFEKAFLLLENEIARLKARVEDLEYMSSLPKTKKKVNVTFSYNNYGSGEINFTNFTTTVDEGSKIPRANLHVGAVWITDDGRKWNFDQWLVKSDITLYEKR